MWEDVKIVHGKPRHNQSQDSVERVNRDVEDICWLRGWQKTIIRIDPLVLNLFTFRKAESFIQVKTII